MATQNTQTVQRAWQKVAGASGLGNLDPLFQFFSQLNAVINDTQNCVYTSAALTGGGVTIPTMTAVRALAGGVYVLSGTTIPALPVTPVIPVSAFGLYFFTIDGVGTNGTLRSYAGAGNGATTRAGLTLPNPLPGPGEAVIGMMEIATDGTHTFTPGTTSLNGAGITTTLINFLGDTGFTAVTMVEQDTA